MSRMLSCLDWSSTPQPPNSLNRHILQRAHHKVGSGSTQLVDRMVSHKGDGDASHAACPDGLDAGHGIFENDAVLCRRLQALGGDLKDLGIGFAAACVLGGTDRLEE